MSFSFYYYFNLTIVLLTNTADSKPRCTRSISSSAFIWTLFSITRNIVGLKLDGIVFSLKLPIHIHVIGRNVQLKAEQLMDRVHLVLESVVFVSKTMTSDFYFTATSWFPGNVRVKPHSKHSGGGSNCPLPRFRRSWIMISQKILWYVKKFFMVWISL